MQARAHFLLGQAALGEELLHQRVVRLGDVFDELAVQLLAPARPTGPLAGASVYLPLLSPAKVMTSLRGTSSTWLNPGPGIDRDGQREDPFAEMLADLGQALVEIRLLLVEGIDHDHLGNAVLGGELPDRVGAHADAVVGVNDDHGEIADPQGAERLADEIGVARAVDDVELLAEPFQRA